MFDYAKFRSTAVAVVGTIILTSVSVGAAVGPARQLEIAPRAAAVQPGSIA